MNPFKVAISVLLLIEIIGSTFNSYRMYTLNAKFYLLNSTPYSPKNGISGSGSFPISIRSLMSARRRCVHVG